MKKTRGYTFIQIVRNFMYIFKRRLRSSYNRTIRPIATIIGIVISVTLIYSYYCNPLHDGLPPTTLRNYDDMTYLSNSYYKTSYLPNSPFEYWYLLSQQGRVYYDSIANFSWETTYVYYFEESYDYDFQCNIDAEIFYAFDHPESELMQFGFFSENGFQGESSSIAIGITPKVKKEIYLSKISKVDAEINHLVLSVNQEENIVTKYRLIYNWLTTNVYYDYDDASREEINLNSHNIYGAIVEKKAVCDGISDAFKYICNKCDLPCITIRGNTESTVNDDSIGHQWNIVPIYGTWFLVDCTFDLRTTKNSDTSINNSTEFTYTVPFIANHFLQVDIEFEGRTSLYDGVPGYSKESKMCNNSFLRTTSLDNLYYSSSIETLEGIAFYSNADYVLMPAPGGDIFFSEIYDDVTQAENKNLEISSNIGKISHALYLNYKGNLIASENCNSILSCYDYYKDSSMFVKKIILYTEYNNEIYVTNFIWTIL